jgi:hypothetical protein
VIPALPGPSENRLRLRLSAGDACHRWLGGFSTVVAWLGLLLAVVSPPAGNPWLRCWFHAATGLPCPGCGLTRSLSCALRGRFWDSWGYHPMGAIILALFVAVALVSLLPARPRERLAGFIRARNRFFDRLYVGFVVVFLGFGILRALLAVGAAVAH